MERTAIEAAIEGVAIEYYDVGTANEATVKRAAARMLGTDKEWEENFETLLGDLVGRDLIYVKEDSGSMLKIPNSSLKWSPSSGQRTTD